VNEEAVLSFVRNSLGSAWSVELLLLLQREPRRSWSAAALIRELRGSIQLVEESIAILEAAGLATVNTNGELAYQPRSPELAELVAALADLHARKPFTVLRTIFTSPSDKIRSFSDAFRFKKGNEP
jgi:hypothetical protein